ncbi:CYTH domain-containing protein [Streptomyces sp. NPDC003077]|uniref:class IV adenylate cyclase n=1 Tax=Streptomyces sp. NPDC003077 TaxID=3154443 RepID=UPI0033AD2729
MIEAELKARVRAPEAVLTSLEERAVGRSEVYQDTYFDTPEGALASMDCEVRVRTVHGPNETRSLLTYKTARVDEASGAKPEHETQVSDPRVIRALLQGLGYVEAISFEKRCRNFEFVARGRAMIATLVRVPEITGTFIELETQAEQDELQDALDDVWAVLEELGIGEADLTTEQYTDAVRAKRATRS